MFEQHLAFRIPQQRIFEYRESRDLVIDLLTRPFFDQCLDQGLRFRVSTQTNPNDQMISVDLQVLSPQAKTLTWFNLCFQPKSEFFG